MNTLKTTINLIIYNYSVHATNILWQIVMFESTCHPLFWHTEPLNEREAAKCLLNDSVCREMWIQWTVHRKLFMLVITNTPVLTLRERNVCFGNKSMMNRKTWMTLKCQTDIYTEFLYFVGRASRYIFLEITNLTHFFYVFLYLFHVSTRFKHHSAHHQGIELY
jgi:hypothetical protein